MKDALLLLAISLLGALSVQAQTLGVSQAATAEQRLAEDLGVDRLRNALQLPNTDARNTATLLQMGTGNAATINQTSLGVPPNQATVVQAGAGNAVGLTQTGSNNQTAFGQTGNANQANIEAARSLSLSVFIRREWWLKGGWELVLKRKLLARRMNQK